MKDEVIIREIELPSFVRGYTKLDAEGIYNIYINKDKSDEQKAKTLEHELKHIKNGDILKKDADINKIEKQKNKEFNFDDITFLNRVIKL